MRPPERLLAASQFEHAISDIGGDRRLMDYAEPFGLDPTQDLAYRERTIYGYVGVDQFEQRP